MLNTSTMTTAKKEESSPRVLCDWTPTKQCLDTSAHAQTLPSRLDYIMQLLDNSYY